MDIWHQRIDEEFGTKGAFVMKVEIFDDVNCSLGEGPLWHPERGEFFWFDINTCMLYAKSDGARREWRFDGHVTAAGWIDRDHLMVAHERALLHFNIETGAHDVICALEADNPITRSNDGRADPWGGFWIGTMGKGLEPDAGAIYRYCRGELRTLYTPWTIPNAQCFAPDGSCAYLTDTPKGVVLRQALDPKTGWPVGDPEPFLPMPEDTYRPDGAVVDAEGNIWIAHYGHFKITCHAPDGRQLHQIDTPAQAMTCPAFGGVDGTTLYATSAAQAVSDDQLHTQPHAGRTFVMDLGIKGQAEHKVIL